MDDLARFGPALMLGFGPIRHTRLRPVRHAFDYPGFFLRMRIDGGAAQRVAAGLGRWFGFDRPGPISFRSTDHGDGTGALESWARGLCAQAGVTADGPIWRNCF